MADMVAIDIYDDDWTGSYDPSFVRSQDQQLTSFQTNILNCQAPASRAAFLSLFGCQVAAPRTPGEPLRPARETFAPTGRHGPAL